MTLQGTADCKEYAPSYPQWKESKSPVSEIRPTQGSVADSEELWSRAAKSTTETNWTDSGIPSKENLHANTPVERQEPKPVEKRWRNIRAFGWWWEIGGTVVSIASMALIIGILFVMDNKPLEDWKLPIQPNSLIAVFTTISKAALLVPVAGCISELKWGHFNRPRQLSDMQAFDEASRGPWGSFTLLFRVRAWLTWVAAIITVASLAFEPLAQQVIRFSSEDVLLQNSTGGYVAQARTWSNVRASTSDDPLKAGAIARMLELELLVASAGILGLLNDTGLSPTLAPRGFNCPTSSCRVPDYTTLAACGTCKTVETTGYEGLDYRYHIAGPIILEHTELDGYFNRSEILDLFTQWPNITWSDVYSDCWLSPRQGYPGAFSDWTGSAEHDICSTQDTISGSEIAPGPLSEYYGGYDPMIKPLTDEPMPIETIARATTFKNTAGHGLDSSNPEDDPCTTRKMQTDLCSLSICAEQHKSVMANNGSITTTNIKKIPFKRVDNDTADPTYLRAVIDGDNGEEVFKIEQEGLRDLIQSVQNTYEQVLKNFSGSSSQGMADFNHQDWTPFTAAMADYLTGRIQSARNPNATNLAIEAFVPMIYVQVRWPWLIMPLALIGFSTLLLLLTMIDSSKRGYLFKSSILATLLCGVDSKVLDDMNEGPSHRRKTERGLLHLAKDVQVILRRNHTGDLKLVKGDG